MDARPETTRHGKGVLPAAANTAPNAGDRRLRLIPRRPLAPFLPPLRLFAEVLVIVFAVEVAVMVLLPGLSLLDHPWARAFADAGLLTLLSAPIIWRTIIRPLRLLAVTEQAKSSAIVNTAADGIIIANRQGLIQSFNAAAERLFGYAADEAIGQNITILMPLPHKQAHDSYLAHYIRTGKSSVICTRREVNGQRKDGTTVPLELSVGGARVGGRWFFTAIARDITERKRAEEALRESEEHFRSLTENASDLVAILRIDGTICYASPSHERLLGFRPEELVGQNTVTLVHPDDVAVAAATAVHAAEHPGVAQPFEWRARHKDGSWRHVESIVKAVHKPQGLVAIINSRDITDRKRAEVALRESEERHRSLFADASDMVYTHDIKGRYTWVNIAAERLTGYTRAELLRMDITQLLLPNSLMMAEGYTPGRYGMNILTKDGGEVSVEVAAQLVLRDGQPVGWQGIVRDISERKRFEGELARAKDVAEAANRAKSEFVANMSHEIRTPLNGIIGMTELALQTELTAEQSEYLQMVAASGDALVTVINDVLDFSKMEAGKLDLDAVDFDLRDCLGGTMRALALRAHVKGLELVYEIRPDVPAMLVADPHRLRQILTNLIGNAIKFTEQGEVVVAVEMADGESLVAPEAVDKCKDVLREPQHERSQSPSNEGSSAHTEPFGVAQDMLVEGYFQRQSTDSRQEGHGHTPSATCHLRFSVRDTGIGIPAEKQQAIFNAFEQADASTTRKYGGTGLGLTISRQLVEMMGGRICVESEEGRGSTFHFTMRCARPPQQLTRHSLPAADLRDLPVLVVDDNATNRRILNEMFVHWRMRPTTVNGGEAALGCLLHAVAAGTPFPLVLIDAHMPEMGGFDLADRIKHTPALAGAILMMLSSADLMGEAARCRELGVASFLIKPIRQSELLDAIRLALGSVTLAEPRPAVSLESSPPSPRHLHVLLAEDNVVNQRLAVRLLEKRGHTVVVANNGREALAAFANDTFDLVLMDVQMPEMDGFEATAQIRRREAQGSAPVRCRTPIVAMTAHAMQGDEERCLAAGVDGYVAKPIQTKQLFAIIDSVTSHQAIAA